MANKSIKFFNFLVIALISCSVVIVCDEPVAHFIYENSNKEVEWDVIEDGWPVEDPEDRIANKRSQFFYIRDREEMLNWKINATFVKTLENTSSDFKIHFKTWLYYIANRHLEPTVEYLSALPHKARDSYFDGNIIGLWSETTEFAVSYDELTRFSMQINPKFKENVIALKNFALEYETKDDVRNDFLAVSNVSDAGIRTNHWFKYSNPVDSNDEEFIYFSDDCNHGCYLISNDFDARESSTAELSFWYYNSDEANKISVITSQLITGNFNTKNEWQRVDVKDIENPNDITISVTTKASAGLADNAFVAFKNIEVTVIGGETKTHRCTQYDCAFNVTELLWTKHMPQLSKPIYYYTRNKYNDDNSLEIVYNSSTVPNIFGTNSAHNDVCILLEYFTAPENRVTLNVQYSIIGDSYTDTILTIRPKSGQTDSSYFCMNDLIALNAKDFVISLRVKQYGTHDGVNGFALRIDVQPQTTETPTFDDELLAFLSAWNDENFLDPIKWPSEWKSLDKDFSARFRFTPNSIRFTAIAIKYPASGHLFSNWIKYDTYLHRIDAIFSIETRIESHFNAFSVKPKVCDWLMHCIDAVITNETKQTTTLRTHRFKFTRLKHTKYIKLMFVIEYYKPADTVSEIEFDLRLIHFGDPCYSSKCDVQCQSDKRNLNVAPNIPDCECEPQYMQDSVCETINYCSVNNNLIRATMGRICYDAELECENIFDETTGKPINARCVCDKDSRIIWDDKKFACTEPNSPTLTNWTAVSASGYYYPISDNNELVVNFTKIDNKTYDVCLNVNYRNSDVVNLIVEYRNHTTGRELFTLSLHDEPDGRLNFCVRHFRYSFDADFAISFAARNATDWSESRFRLSYTVSVKPLTPSIKYLRNWHHVLDNDSYRAWIDWVAFIPSECFRVIKQNAFHLNFSASLSTSKTSTALLVSEWIEFNSILTSRENLLSFDYPKSLNSSFGMKIRIVDKNSLLGITAANYIDRETLLNGDPVFIRANKTAFPITPSIGDVFKIVIEISYTKILSESDSKLNISFNTITIGDPCYDHNGHQFLCKHNEICVGKSPDTHQCVCKFGQQCDTECKPEEHEYCNKFPSIHGESYGRNNCKIIDPNLTTRQFQCICAEDYVWNNTYARCVRKSYTTNVLKCDGPIVGDSIADCVFMEHTTAAIRVLQWTNGNLPRVLELSDKRLSFYCARKANSTLKINIENLNKSRDACVKFRYYITDGANLLIKFNNNLIIDITPTKVYDQSKHKEITDWLPENSDNEEEICIRKYYFHNDESNSFFNITFVANIAIISRDMIALKFSDTRNTSFPQRKISVNELPYLIHWSRKYSLNNIEEELYDTNYDFANQWPISFPSDKWHVDRDKADSITFTDIATGVKRNAYLMSNWLQKEVDGYKLRFIVSGSEMRQFLNVAIETLVYNNSMHVIQQFDNRIIGDSRVLSANSHLTANNSIMLFLLSKAQTPFRVGFTAHYQLVQHSSLAAKHFPVTFRFESIDLGDPCVNDNTKLNHCSDHGNCTRRGPVSAYSCNCVPAYNTNPLNCDTKNYCEFIHSVDGEQTTGTAYCLKKNAGSCMTLMHTLGELYFECQCTSKTVWHEKNRTCATNMCITFDDNCDSHTQQCLEPIDETTEPTCHCLPGYVSVTAVANKTHPCELYDPCNAKHNPKPCGDNTKAQCFHTFDDDIYECICPLGYRTVDDKQLTTCVSKMCDIHGLHNCQQICNRDDTHDRGYVCGCHQEMYSMSVTNNSECILISGKQCACEGNGFCVDNQCSCVNGYLYNQIAKKCEIDVKSIDREFCEDDQTPYIDPTSGALTCECNNDLFEKIGERCELKPMCADGSDGRITCASKGAKCVSDRQTLTVWCECPVGTIFEDGNTTLMPHDHPLNYRCVDLCAVDNRIERCELSNARCDASRLMREDEEMPKLLADVGDWHEYCVCKPGYVRKSTPNRCVLALYAYELNVSIKNTFHYSSNLSIVYEKSVNFHRETSVTVDRRKRQTVVARSFDLLNSDNKYRYLIDSNSSYHFNVELDTISREKHIGRYELANTVSQHLSGILLAIGLRAESVAAETCSLNVDHYYDCVFAIVFDATTTAMISVSDDITKRLSAKCPDSSVGCTVNPTYPLIIKKFSAHIYDPCSESRRIVNCPQYTACNRIDERSSYFSCHCNATYFDANSNRTVLNQNGSSVTYIETCKPKDLCDERCTGGKCFQNQPIYENSVWSIEAPQCVCDNEQQILSSNGTECLEPCVSTERCNNRGTCHVSTVSQQFVCNCEKGYYGRQCEHTRGVTAWIVSVSVLAVMSAAAIGFAFWFAYKHKNTSQRATLNNSCFTNHGLSLEELRAPQRSATQAHQTSLFNQ